jgi:hypothetical protein
MADYKTLSLAFLHPATDDDIVNVLTARVSKHSVCHVELIFDGGQAFSIYHNGVVSIRPRTMSNPGYEIVTISVTADEYRACHRFCTEAVKDGYTFDNMGMYYALVHPGACAHKSSARVRSTFCSKIITEALQHAGIGEVSGLSASAMTPSRLYTALEGSERRVCHAVRPLVKNGLTLMLMEPLRINCKPFQSGR